MLLNMIDAISGGSFVFGSFFNGFLCGKENLLYRMSGKHIFFFTGVNDNDRKKMTLVSSSDILSSLWRQDAAQPTATNLQLKWKKEKLQRNVHIFFYFSQALSKCQS